MTWFFGRLFLDENTRTGKFFIFVKNGFRLENAGTVDKFRQIPPEMDKLEFLPEKPRGFHGRGEFLAAQKDFQDQFVVTITGGKKCW